MHESVCGTNVGDPMTSSGETVSNRVSYEILMITKSNFDLIIVYDKAPYTVKSYVSLTRLIINKLMQTENVVSYKQVISKTIYLTSLPPLLWGKLRPKCLSSKNVFT